MINHNHKETMKRAVLAISAVFALLALTGCALTPDTIDLRYKQPQGVAQIAGAGDISVKVTVADQRTDKTKVSSKKNGYGMEMAPILASEDVAITVRKAIESELQARGFALGSDAALVLISADLSRFYNDYKTGFFSGDAVADLNMLVSLKSKSGSVLYTRMIVAQGIEPKIQLASGDNAKLALDRALENAMKTLFEDKAFISAMTSANAQKTAAK